MLSSPESILLTDADQQTLLDVAEQSIEIGLETRRIMEPEVASYSEDLRHVQSSFVTLRLQEQLRGSAGSIEATVPLISDVSCNASRAAFNNGRFPSLNQAEFDDLIIQITVLSPLRHLITRSFGDVIAYIQPGVDGVVLRLGGHVATFLPDVWETLQDPVEFFRHLRLKAGLDPDRWSPRIRVSTYRTQRMIRSRRQSRASRPSASSTQPVDSMAEVT
ncbi:AmmeMemoRadiSam system protein A [Novipirellula artificiosorum]|uniref:AMMECR1 domain-containing protein n=1 Tax=Novipirellula artificiosorum TaxID=2528016 RepID=A0A5C6D9X9_9BACT|nr:AmmeMemoRadiSam system protein A [Novipirellula artificiosorum]TWU33732.1 hypothetical protein Poly41_47280 [Novipirellula artificiosorum]